MFTKVVADRYAMALLHSCPDLATIERVKDELVVIKETWDISRDTRDFLLNPKIPPKIKKLVLEKALSDKLSPVMMKLLALLIDKHRQNILPDIADMYIEATDRVRGVEHAEIIVAVQATPDISQKLLDAVQRFSTREVEVTFKVDPSIIGGVVIKLGDRVIDGSLKRRFSDLRRAMLAARLPMITGGEGTAADSPG
jgi:F-type H+-transporting ATPase subunit delta